MAPSSTAPVRAAEAPLHLLLVEDDEGDAFLVERTAAGGGPEHRRAPRPVAGGRGRVALHRGPRLRAARPRAAGRDRPRRARAPARRPARRRRSRADRRSRRPARRRGGRARARRTTSSRAASTATACARAVLYAVERRRADRPQRELRAAELLRRGRTRLERGLLPQAARCTTARLGVSTGYRPGRERTLLGGDFYDAVELDDGTLHLVIGDVSGHGPDEAALGVCLRVAWRTLIARRRPPDGAPADAAARCSSHERHAAEIFATVLHADRRARPRARRACAARAIRRRSARRRRGLRALECARGPPLGFLDDAAWPATRSRFPRAGPAAVHRRADRGTGRTGGPGGSAIERLMALVARPAGDAPGPRTPPLRRRPHRRGRCAATAASRSTTSPRCSSSGRRADG